MSDVLAWGNKVSPEFRAEVTGICGRLSIVDPSWLMACMAWETGSSFNPSIKNAAGSGAVGLIQFMPATASALGTTTELLAKMTAIDQLTYVEKFFHPWAGKLKSLADVYGAILWPSMIGKPDDYVVFNSTDLHHPKLYIQNAGLDLNHDGKITKHEIVAKVEGVLSQGLLAMNRFPPSEFVGV